MKLFHKRMGHGFTLVEMLVVVTIIILLVTMLMPSLERSFELANRAVCASNLRKSGEAASQYRASFGFYPPNWSWGTQGEAPANYNKYETKDGWERSSNWVGAKNPMYTEFLNNLGTLRCPSNVNTYEVTDYKEIPDDQPLPSGASGSALQGYNLRYDNGRIFYFFEWNHNLSKIRGYARVQGNTLQTTTSKPKDIENWHIWWYTKSDPAKPAQTYVYYEADDGANGSTGQWNGSNHPRILTGTFGANDAGGNIVFADGHAEWLTGPEKEEIQKRNEIENNKSGGRFNGRSTGMRYGVYVNAVPDHRLSGTEAELHRYRTRD